MFYYLQGPIAILEPNLAVVDCGGVGMPAPSQLILPHS